jgi:hypothetical protein
MPLIVLTVTSWAVSLHDCPDSSSLVSMGAPEMFRSSPLAIGASSSGWNVASCKESVKHCLGAVDDGRAVWDGHYEILRASGARTVITLGTTPAAMTVGAG